MSDVDDVQDAEQPTEQPETDDARTDDFGATLREAREKAGLSAADVAKALKITAHAVDALEDQRYEDLPPMPYIRGYVQRYARLVGVDAGSVTVGFNAVSDVESAVPVIVPRSRRTLFADFARQSWGLLYGSVVLVSIIVIGGALWWAWSGETNQSESTLDTAADSAAGDGVPLAAERPSTLDVANGMDATVRPEPNPPSDAIPVTSQPAERVAIDPLSTDVGALEPGVVEEEAEAGETATEQAGSVGPDLISFVFGEDSWVEVRDRNDNLVYGDLGREGDEVTLSGEAPFKILVGYASGVEVTFNGERVALGPGTRGDVARLVVGN